MSIRSRDLTAAHLTSVAATPSFVTEWDALAHQLDAPPFRRPGWYARWAGAFASLSDLYVLQVRRRDRLVAALPVLRWRGGWRSATNGHTPAYAPLSVDEDATRTLVRSLAEGSYGAFRLEGMVLSERDREVWEDGLGRGPSRHDLDVEGGSTWTDLRSGAASLEAALPPKFRKELDRGLRRAEARGTVRLEQVRGGPRLTGTLTTGFRIEASGWKGREGTAIASLPWTRRFYEQLAEWSAANGWLRLTLLWVGDDPVAFGFDLEHAGTRYALKIGYEEAHGRLSPGKLINRQVLLAAADDPDVRRYDWLGDASRDCRQWGTGHEDRWLVATYPRGWGGTARRALDGTEDALADWARSHLPERARARLRAMHAQREGGPSHPSGGDR